MKKISCLFFVMMAGCIANAEEKICTINSIADYEKSHPDVYRVSEEISQPVLTKKQEMEIPESVKKLKKSIGPTIVVGIISKDGKFESPCILRSSGNADWDRASVKAIKEWKYRPAIKAGSPVKVFQTITCRPEYR
jgi:periplasmic protein TonB